MIARNLADLKFKNIIELQIGPIFLSLFLEHANTPMNNIVIVNIVNTQEPFYRHLYMRGRISYIIYPLKDILWHTYY